MYVYMYYQFSYIPSSIQGECYWPCLVPRCIVTVSMDTAQSSCLAMRCVISIKSGHRRKGKPLPQIVAWSHTYTHTQGCDSVSEYEWVELPNLQRTEMDSWLTSSYQNKWINKGELDPMQL